MQVSQEQLPPEVLLVGTSNCILRHGFADGLSASLADQCSQLILTNLSAGASSSSYHLSSVISRRDQFSSARAIILDFIVNDCSYIRRGLLSLSDAMMTMSFLLSTIRSITSAPVIILGFHERDEDLSFVRPYLSTLIRLSEEIGAIFYPIKAMLSYYSRRGLIDQDFYEDSGHISRFYSHIFGYALGFYIKETFLHRLIDPLHGDTGVQAVGIRKENCIRLIDLCDRFISHEKHSSLRREIIYSMTIDDYLEVNCEDYLISSLCIDARSSSALLEIFGRDQTVSYFHACFPSGPKLQVKTLHLPLRNQPYKLRIMPTNQQNIANIRPLLHSRRETRPSGIVSVINATAISLKAYDEYRNSLLPRMMRIDLTDKQMHDYFKIWIKAFAPFLSIFDFSRVSLGRYNKIKFASSAISW